MHACKLTLLGSVLVIPDKVWDDSDIFSGGIVGDVGPKFPEKLTEIEEVALPVIKETNRQRQIDSSTLWEWYECTC